MTDDGLFAGRSILVTGASSGLGAAAVRRFAAGGGRVYAASRDQDKLAEVAASCDGLPGEVRFGPLDVSSPAECRSCRRRSRRGIWTARRAGEQRRPT